MPDNRPRDPLGPGRQMTPSNEFGRLISQKITSEADTFYHHYDALGSTASLTDSAEVVTDEYDYEAFGDTAVETGATPNPYQWVAQVGYRKDEETGLYDLRRRKYSPGAGRFTSEDPIRSDEENLYRYVGNRAVQGRDPNGLEELTYARILEIVRGDGSPLVAQKPADPIAERIEWFERYHRLLNPLPGMQGSNTIGGLERRLENQRHRNRIAYEQEVRRLREERIHREEEQRQLEEELLRREKRRQQIIREVREQAENRQFPFAEGSERMVYLSSDGSVPTVNRNIDPGVFHQVHGGQTSSHGSLHVPNRPDLPTGSELLQGATEREIQGEINKRIASEEDQEFWEGFFKGLGVSIAHLAIGAGPARTFWVKVDAKRQLR